MLQFKSDQFKVLVMGDIQVHGMPEPTECDTLRRLVKKANPDFIIFLGDMISGVGGYKKAQLKKMIHTIIDATAGDKIPFAVVSGNHDHYAKTPYYRQLEIYRAHGNCLTPTKHDRICKDAYTLDLVDKKGKPVLRFFLLDCAGTRFLRLGLDYKATKPATLAFTRNTLKDPTCPPSVVFQHIIVPDVARLFDIYDEKLPGTVRGRGIYRGLYLKLAHRDAGILGECPCPSSKNTVQFSDWVRSGKVKAAVFAHDHKNSFVDTLDGIKLIQCPCAGLSCYGKDSTRGGYLLTISTSGKITPTPIYHQELA